MKLISIVNWRRPDMYRMVLTALQNNDGVEDYRIFNYVDPSSPPQAQDAFHEIDRTHPLAQKCRGIDTVISARGGCAGNTFESINNCFLMMTDPRWEPGPKPDDFVLHLEDDILPGRDWIRFMEWGAQTYFEDKGIFLVTGFNRRTENLPPAMVKAQMPLVSRRHTPVKEHLTYQGWGIWRDRWEPIAEDWFGIHWTSSEPFHVGEGEKFLTQVRKADDGSWGWPMKQYHRRGRQEIYPLVSRTQNIGNEGGRFNQSSQWHLENVHSNIWSDQLAPPLEYVEVGR